MNLCADVSQGVVDLLATSGVLPPGVAPSRVHIADMTLKALEANQERPKVIQVRCGEVEVDTISRGNLAWLVNVDIALRQRVDPAVLEQVDENDALLAAIAAFLFTEPARHLTLPENRQADWVQIVGMLPSNTESLREVRTYLGILTTQYRVVP